MMPLLNTGKLNIKLVTKTVAAFCAAGMLMGAMATTTYAKSHGKSMDDVLAGEHRSDRNKARDKYRHPKETLEFFGLKSNMSVVEISPGGGWYQEILAPYLHAHGTYYSVGGDLDIKTGGWARANQRQAQKLIDHPDLYGKIIITELVVPNKMTIAPAGSADMVLSFRSFHNWEEKKQGKIIFKAVFDALKPGGIFGITDHRNENAPGGDGYVKTSNVIAAAESLGFVLVAKSEINANAKDNHSHEKGVWTLLPNLGGKEADRERIRAIGESDRMTLKFIKPAK